MEVLPSHCQALVVVETPLEDESDSEKCREEEVEKEVVVLKEN